MLLRWLTLGIVFLVVAPERLVAPPSAASIDNRAFCERNTGLCSAPSEFLREIRRKTALLTDRFSGSHKYSVTGTPDPSSISQQQSDARYIISRDPHRLSVASKDTLTAGDLKPAWRAPNQD